jgi:hypothetical protein
MQIVDFVFFSIELNKAGSMLLLEGITLAHSRIK